jgi:hypothetical protein
MWLQQPQHPFLVRCQTSLIGRGHNFAPLLRLQVCPVVAACPALGKSNTNNLPAPTNLTENPYGKKKRFFEDVTQNSASMVAPGIAIEVQPWSPIFEKNVLIFEKKGGC